MKEKREDRQSLTMTKVTTRLEIGLAVVMEECHLQITVGVDFIQKYGQNYRLNYRGRRQDNYRNDFRRGNYGETQNYRGQNYRSGCRDNYRADI